ncbi:hypothetical protein D9613_012941 [Agrocybe pediades]|uniref:F-box domain-containing protein n=1 Tax=Agrocybe pediades TaxID=84607 RepID=A0A8H4VHB0_9AGAR|nr:hypothetical protein D9613_012941 [Agrocybe pediades]
MILNEDLLLLVFNTISKEPDVHIEHRQAAIRYASQVCQGWRNLILSASSIWGRLIWINPVQRLDWMQEVLERAETSSSLCATVELSGVSWGTQDGFVLSAFTLSALKKIWERLEEVDIDTASDLTDYGRKFESGLWHQMETSAPNLRVFAFCDSTWMDRSPSANLFNNNAPRLQEFTTHLLIAPQSASWFSHITTLYFIPESIEDVCNAVLWAPCLRVLRLGEQLGELDLEIITPEDCDRVASLSPAILPRLARISDLQLSFDQFNALWSSRFVSPAESYTYIRVMMNDDGYDDEGQELKQAKLLGSLSNFFYHHAGITSSNIHNHDLQWYVEAGFDFITIEAQAHTVPELYMKLYFDLDDDHDSNDWIRFLARAITEYARSTGNFNLHIAGNLEKFLCFDVFDSLLLSLASVEMIRFDLKTLQYYCELEENGRPLFPKLQTIHYVLRRGIYAIELKLLKTFLMRRVKAGRPVSSIHFEGPKNDDDTIYNALHDVGGLQITCG